MTGHITGQSVHNISIPWLLPGPLRLPAISPDLPVLLTTLPEEVMADMAVTILQAVATAEATEAIFRQLLPVAVMAVDMGGATVATVVEAMVGMVAVITLPAVAAVEVPAVIPVVEMDPGTVMAATALPVVTTAHNWAAGNKRQIQKPTKPSSGCLTAIRMKMMIPSWTTRKQAKMMIPGWTTRKQAKQSPMTSNQPGNRTECEPLFPSLE